MALTGLSSKEEMSYIPFNTIKTLIESSGVATQSTVVNGSGETIPALTPVSVNYMGTLQGIDVSDETSALTVIGVTIASIPNGQSGVVVTQGRIVDVALSFNVGDYIYVSKTGELMNYLPETGEGGFSVGDYIIRIGVIAKNESNPAKKDMFVGISIIGQL